MLEYPLEVIQERAKQNREIHALIQRVLTCWEAVGDCYDEFDDGRSGDGCGEYVDALDTAILDLMRVADPKRYERREQRMREAAEAGIREA